MDDDGSERTYLLGSNFRRVGQTEIIANRDVRLTDSLNIVTKVYLARWWILFIFSMTGFMQCAVWNTWGPIMEAAKLAYPSWTDTQFSLLSLWAMIIMLFGLIPFTFLLQTHGLRFSMLLSTGLLAASTAVRLFATDGTAFTVLAHIGAIMNGFAGIIISSAPSLVSAAWFPPNERTTATAIGCTFNQLGNAGGFFLGPYLVFTPINGSHPASEDSMDSEIMQEKIRDYMWIVAALCVPLYLMCLAYFPSRPKHPPSVASAIHRVEAPISQEAKMLAKNWNLWMLLIPYGLTIGVNVGWSGVLDLNLSPFGISQEDASMIGVYMTVGGVALAVLASRLTDLLFGYMKATILALLFSSCVAFTWLLLILNKCLPFDATHVMISAVMGASLSYATSPLFFELAMEIAFPVSEGVVGCALALSWNALAAIFLGIIQIGYESPIWMNYLLSGQAFVAFFVTAFLMKEEYRRSALDQRQPQTNTADSRDEAESAVVDSMPHSSPYGAIGNDNGQPAVLVVA